MRLAHFFYLPSHLAVENLIMQDIDPFNFFFHPSKSFSQIWNLGVPKFDIESQRSVSVRWLSLAAGPIFPNPLQGFSWGN